MLTFYLKAQNYRLVEQANAGGTDREAGRQRAPHAASPRNQKRDATSPHV